MEVSTFSTENLALIDEPKSIDDICTLSNHGLVYIESGLFLIISFLILVSDVKLDDQINFLTLSVPLNGISRLKITLVPSLIA